MDPAAEQHLSQLLERAQAGDAAAYREFLLATRQSVVAFLRGRLRSPAALEDVLQETLLSIHCSRHTYDPSRPIGPWIRAIALNRLRDFGRVRKREQDHAATDLDWEKARHGSHHTDAKVQTLLRAAFETLSEAQRMEVKQLIIKAASQFQRGARITFPIAVRMVAGRKPG